MAELRHDREDERHRVRRQPERGRYDRAAIREILREGMVCHVGFTDAHGPVVIPTAYGLVGEEIVVHGLPASRLLGVLRSGTPICVTVTLFDGLVLARSAFEHSMNYRSVVVFGQARWIRDQDEKLAAVRALSEHLLPGRWADVRPPTVAELRRTHVLAISMDQVSAKVRSGPPSPEDDDWDAWTGVLPAAMQWGAPQPDPARGPHDVGEPPGYLPAPRPDPDPPG